MSAVTQPSKFVRPSRMYIAGLVVCWGAFAFFTICQLLPKETSSQDAEKVKELAALTPMAIKSSVTDWPGWRGPRRDGVSSETGLLTTWPEGGPRRLWEAPAGEGFSSLAVAAGRIYSMMQDQDQEAIVCWDQDTGRELWRHRYPASFHHKFGNGPRATPTVDGDLLFTIGATGILTCLKLPPSEKRGQEETPTLLWTKHLLEEFGAVNLEWGIAHSPLVDGDLVFVNPGGPDGRSCAALEKRTGAIRWQVLDDPAGNSSPMLAYCAGAPQVIFFTERGLVALTPEEGKLLWRYPWATEFGANIATPIVWDDYVFLSSGYGKGCALLKIERNGAALEPKRVYKNLKMSNHFSSCVLYENHLYGFNDTTLTCMDFRTGKVAWTERGFDKGSLIIADGHLFILGEYGTLAVAEATPAGYREQSRFEFSHSRCWSVPVIAGGRMYVRDQEKIASFDLKSPPTPSPKVAARASK